MSGCGSDPSCITRRGGGGCKCGDQVKKELEDQGTVAKVRGLIGRLSEIRESA